MRRSTIDPRIAIIMLPKLTPETVPNPRIVEIYPPIIAPMIPIIMVIIKPPGSFPGRSSFAIAPAINPNIIQEIKPMIALLQFECDLLNN
jgi:hypothetical protein